MRQGYSKFSMLTQNYTQIGTKRFFPIRKINISIFFVQMKYWNASPDGRRAPLDIWSAVCSRYRSRRRR
jgi:hypothetical protein